MPTFKTGHSVLNRFLNANPDLLEKTFSALQTAKLLDNLPLSLMKISIKPLQHQASLIKIIAKKYPHASTNGTTLLDAALNNGNPSIIKIFSHYGGLGCFNADHLQTVLQKCQETKDSKESVDILVSALSATNHSEKLLETEQTAYLHQMQPQKLATAFIASLSDIVNEKKEDTAEALKNREKIRNTISTQISDLNATLDTLTSTLKAMNADTTLIAQAKDFSIEYLKKQIANIDSQIKAIKPHLLSRVSSEQQQKINSLEAEKTPFNKILRFKEIPLSIEEATDELEVQKMKLLHLDALSPNPIKSPKQLAKQIEGLRQEIQSKSTPDPLDEQTVKDIAKLESQLTHLKIEEEDLAARVKTLQNLFEGKSLLSGFFACRIQKNAHDYPSIFGFPDTYKMNVAYSTLAPEKDGSTFTHLAAKYGIEPYIEGLLEEKQYDSFYIKDANGETPISILLRNGDYAIAMKVLAYTPDLDKHSDFLRGLSLAKKHELHLQAVCNQHIEKCRTFDIHNDGNTAKAEELLVRLKDSSILINAYLGPKFFEILDRREKLLQLTDHYRKLSFLATASNHEYKNKGDYISKYATLHQALLNETNVPPPLLVETLQRYKLPLTSDAFKTEKEKLLRRTDPPDTVYLFNDEAKSLSADNPSISQVTNVIMNLRSKDKNDTLENTTTVCASNDGTASVIYHHSLQTASVERYRENKDGDKQFISETYHKEDPGDLKAWAACAVNRFFAAAPRETEKVLFEDGYSKEQLSALVSYCQVMNYPYDIGPMQKLRLIAQENQATLPRRDQYLHNKKFELTPGLEEIAKLQFKPEKLQDSRFTPQEWQQWLTHPTTRKKYPELAPLGVVKCNKLNSELGHEDWIIKVSAPVPSIHRSASTLFHQTKPLVKSDSEGNRNEVKPLRNGSHL